MPMVRAMRLLNAVETGTLSGAQLETLLTTDPGRLAELNVLLGMRGQARRMAASSTSMAAVIASHTAMTAVIANSTAMTAVAASSTAMAEVIASSTAMAAVWASDTALTAIQASITALDVLINAATQRLYADCTTSGTALLVDGSTSMAGTKFLVVGTATELNTAGYTITVAGGRAGSAFGNQTFSMLDPALTLVNENISTLLPKVLAKDTAKKLIALDGVCTVSNSYTTRYMNFIAIQIT